MGRVSWRRRRTFCGAEEGRKTEPGEETELIWRRRRREMWGGGAGRACSQAKGPFSELGEATGSQRERSCRLTW